MAEAGEAIDDWRRLRACPGCDYSLETLPPEGTCPECGRRYDQRFVVLNGVGRGQWDTAAGGTWRGMAGQAVWVVILLWLFTMGRRGFSSPTLLAFGVIAVLTLAAQLYARLFSSREPRMQLWLSPDGVGQILSTPEGRRAHLIGRNVSLLFLPIFYVGILLDEGVRLAGLPLAFLVLMLVGAAAVWWRQWRRAGKVDDIDYTPRLWRWGQVKVIKVKALAGDRVRVRCMVTRRFWRLVVNDEWVIDIEVACTANGAEALGRQMVEWCSGRDVLAA